MATLREMLVKIYQPRQGIIEFGDGPPATQDGAPALGILGGSGATADDNGGGGGVVELPGFRSADTGAVGGGGEAPFDYSSLFPSATPNQLQMIRENFERGGQAGEPGGLDRGFDDLPKGNIDDFGGYSTPFGIFGALMGIPGLGAVGSGIDIAQAYSDANEFDPEGTSGGFLGFLEAVANEVTGAGRDPFQSRVDNYQERTGSGLNDDALSAARGVGRGQSSYSGPKGVVGNLIDRNRERGGQAGERSRNERQSGGGGIGGMSAEIF